ncbi:bifunctional diaminohydroxyphosphoribosylaminopyrimidine deaminase/5-amino-6-(5-phosphoribosylamino)uracil reductase RibD [Thiothrix lacustris]|uniref:bifunctional diaminohydroxyphosphoribosylaminopyrimidine deaminase/5-amino-6-(5-phosphoribosylamino)uracil reductase RibD n=1 Tax=Thiothrix lacustris TaxID=525917 RepID=UPI0027E44FD1|nr:bifunctional diaminohydroxyphosphoribosylaminopyrimidine deaminase/5-amino-6-(5-phosphoribosylamino)uracil reductase RibD [Thiothrix lacustris]WMP17872.1 bifunctional diaminohydroxyphosphoribosylaminopyrimidine deaminase/5-amino-6-(5-phosphoribosylamino)uracil reductase RibD [Thiothrix lacustris]
MNFTPDDHRYMARALQLARRGLYTTQPNPRVGCVIVRDGQIVGEGWHERVGEAHAEVHALRMAGEAACGATAYVTLEPCSHYGRTPPCANALVQAGVARVVAAMVDPNPLVAGKGLQMLQQAGITTAAGLLESEARAINPGFISRMERNRPYIRLKMAMSLDGRTAMESGESVWITGEAARRDVQLLRAQAGAILTGIGTVLADNPSLNVRLSADELGISGEVRQPTRVVLDSALQFPLNAAMLTLPGDILLYTCSADVQKIAQLEQAGAKVRCFSGNTLQLSDVMSALVDDGISEVHVEAGATLGGALVEQGFADELVIYLAPHLMGSNARALFNLPHIAQMSERIPLEIRDIRAVGQDWRIIASLQTRG